MIKAILFDLDNTLINFLRMKRMSCEAAINAMIDAGLKVDKGKAMKLLFELYDKHGLEDPRIFQKFLKKVLGKVDYRILAYGVVAYRRVRSGFLEPFPRVTSTLLKLKEKGLRLAIISDAPRLKAWIRLTAMKIDHFFDIVVTFDDTKKLKPSRKPFIVALSKLKFKPEECLMVGDMPGRDIKGAKKLGMKTCFATYGSMYASSKSLADYEIDDISKLLKIV